MAQVKLYDVFNHWYHGGVIWVFSDTHFEDSDCKLMDKNWITPEEQLKILNSKIGKKDTLIHLGDVGNKEWIKQIKGYKVLICGNHDHGASVYEANWFVYTTFADKKEQFGPFKTYEDAKNYKAEFDQDHPSVKTYVASDKLFDEVYEGPLFINDKILLSHEPINLGFGINIHGHNHSGPRKVIKNGCASINMAANVVNYQPERLDKLIEGIKVNDLHRITIDWATEHSLKKNGK